ncbi:hypothetical protein D1007_45114 [Hordeum vulgare]|nr:hypothetical protein D1007_45114 [Hordeum vulgare]
MEAEAEGPHPLPKPVAGRRCGRHPAQPITGVCSSCLVERLASVRSPAHPEIVEVASSSSPSHRHPDAHPVPVSGDQDQGKLRRTLMLLFQMDDSGADRQGAARCPPEAGDPDRADHPGGGGGRGSRWKGASWLRAILPRRGARRRDAKEGEEEEPSRPSGALDPHPHPGDAGGGGPSPPLVERRASFRRSCEWMVCREPPGGRGRSSSSLDPPRHSWDGSMVGRAFACSFACLDDPPDGVTRVRQSNAEDLPAAGVAAEARNGDRAAAAGVASESRNGGPPADVASEGPRFRETRRCSDAGPEITAAASGVRRRRSNRWSRVWDRSITSPLKEFVRKGEHALDRSFSESRRETRRCKNGEMTDIENGEIQHGRSNGSVLPGRASQSSSRSSQAAAVNGDAQNFRADWLKNKECRIGRSRSVHYTSPGNFDNGMLRFYLTPMRSNRTANRGRRRSSRLFGRGLFGFV